MGRRHLGRRSGLAHLLWYAGRDAVGRPRGAPRRRHHQPPRLQPRAPKQPAVAPPANHPEPDGGSRASAEYAGDAAGAGRGRTADRDRQVAADTERRASAHPEQSARTIQNTRFADRNRSCQYDESSRSTRTAPFAPGAWTNSVASRAMPTCDAPGATVEKYTRSPARMSLSLTGAPSRYCSPTVRGNSKWLAPKT